MNIDLEFPNGVICKIDRYVFEERAKISISAPRQSR